MSVLATLRGTDRGLVATSYEFGVAGFGGAVMGSRGQVQRSLSGTRFSAYSMCSPQPSQVGLPQVVQAISWHMVVTSLLLRQRGCRSSPQIQS